ETLKKDWTSYIYAFFKPDPLIEFVNGRECHAFVCVICVATHCKGWTRHVRRYLDTSDAKSISNLKTHAVKCWSEDVVAAASRAEKGTVRETIRKVGGQLQPEVLTAKFKRDGMGPVTYSHMQHTKKETKAEIVKDRGFLSLMKTGHPGYYVPSPSTVARDVKLVFSRTRQRVAKMLQEYPGSLSFATDAWT
ncbi:hypothetical protein BDN70DRAFT_819381, partial [Pholiota conissans]